MNEILIYVWLTGLTIITLTVDEANVNNAQVVYTLITVIIGVFVCFPDNMGTIIIIILLLVVPSIVALVVERYLPKNKTDEYEELNRRWRERYYD